MLRGWTFLCATVCEAHTYRSRLYLSTICLYVPVVLINICKEYYRAGGYRFQRQEARRKRDRDIQRQTEAEVVTEKAIDIERS